MKPIRRAVRLESKDERDTSKEWRELGYMELKVMVCNHNGWPDRWYKADQLGVPAFWCEWKKLDTDPNVEQAGVHEKLRAQGEIVITAHSRKEFWQKVRDLQAAYRK